MCSFVVVVVNVEQSSFGPIKIAINDKGLKWVIKRGNGGKDSI